MDNDALWLEARQLVTVSFLREMAAAWLIASLVGVLLFIK